MAFCIIKTRDEIVDIENMHDGDVGEVLAWEESPTVKGEVIQRYRDSLIFLGKKYIFGYDNWFKEKHPGKYIARRLKTGDLLEFKEIDNYDIH